MVDFLVNGQPVSSSLSPISRLSEVLRDELKLKGTKVGCNAGDCGACTVLLDDKQVCACLTPLGQVAGRKVITVEGVASKTQLNKLQASFQRHGAAQCGICSPGMLMAATELLQANPTPTRKEAEDAIGGVLCRCTGYQKIVDAIVNANIPADLDPILGNVGDRLAKVDGSQKVEGLEQYGADSIPDNSLWLRIFRSEIAAGKFTIDKSQLVAENYSGVEFFLTAEDIPFNGFGIYPHIKDQPVLADGVVHYRGDAVIAAVGEKAALQKLSFEDLPVDFETEEPILGAFSAQLSDARQLHERWPDNVLIDGAVVKGAGREAIDQCDHAAYGQFETTFVEHAYIEPESGWAQKVGDRVEVHATTQAPHMDLDEVSNVLQVGKDKVRIVPTACGGGFGGKLDVSIQPILAVAAMKTDRPVACVYERPESMASSTKRHPSNIDASFGCDENGMLQSANLDAVFDTGAYASWGPTVAGRVPVHGSGPYFVPNVHVSGKGVFTNAPPCGAFRGFGVPQAAIAHECLMDDLAAKLNMDRLDIRLKNAIAVGQETATGQVLTASAGMRPCLEQLQAPWQEALQNADEFNAKSDGVMKRGVGIGAMWYGIGNTALSNPSTMHVGILNDGRIVLYNGAVDIGQGSNTIMIQICAEALGLPAANFSYIMGDTDRTADAGKTSASRQTFVSGKAAELAGLDLRAQILRHANVGDNAQLAIDGTVITISEGAETRQLDLSKMKAAIDGIVFEGQGSFDPPTLPLDDNGQGSPYATYGFAAQVATVDVDTELGRVYIRKIWAAHDVGRAINPTQVEGQIEGGIAQGLGLALMEEYIPGRTENLHDYLIPTAGDMPEIEVLIVEDAEPLGPYGAKGVGEPGLVPTAPAIFGAVRHATGVRVTRAPLLPHRLKAALDAKEAKHAN